jgi:hypothetical protein
LIDLYRRTSSSGDATTTATSWMAAAGRGVAASGRGGDPCHCFMLLFLERESRAAQRGQPPLYRTIETKLLVQTVAVGRKLILLLDKIIFCEDY